MFLCAVGWFEFYLLDLPYGKNKPFLTVSGLWYLLIVLGVWSAVPGLSYHFRILLDVWDVEFLWYFSFMEWHWHRVTSKRRLQRQYINVSTLLLAGLIRLWAAHLSSLNSIWCLASTLASTFTDTLCAAACRWTSLFAFFIAICIIIQNCPFFMLVLTTVQVKLSAVIICSCPSEFFF